MSKKRDQEVQGSFTMKLVTVLLCAFIVVYLGVKIFESFSDPLTTVNAVYSSAEEIIPLNGWILRNETLLPAQTGVVEVTAGEGSRVGVGQHIATVYSDQETLERKQRILQLDTRIKQLEDATQSTADITSTQKLDENLFKGLLSLNKSVETQNFLTLESQSANLKTLIFRRDYAFEDSTGVETLLQELRQERDSLQSGGTSGIRELTAEEAGTYSSMVDGYEAALTTDLLDHVTVASLRHWPDLRETVDSDKYIGKLVKGFTWYYAAVMDYEQARTYRVGQKVTIRLGSSGLEPFSVEVSQIGDDEKGECVVVFESDSFLADTVALRRENADIITESYEGIKVPKDAVRMSENGQLGVYCVLGLQARFRKVEIIYESDTYFLSAYKPMDTSYVRAGDEVIASARDLYDGKIVK